MASKKGKKAKSKAKGGKKKGGWRGSFGGGLLFELGAVMVLGSVLLSKVCKLPAWLSPIGAALWLFGWWRNIPIARSLGLLMIGTGFVQMLGLPQAFSQTIDNAKRSGLLPNVELQSFGGAGVGQQQSSGGGGGGGGNNGNIIEVATDLTNDLAGLVTAAGAVRTAFA